MAKRIRRTRDVVNATERLAGRAATTMAGDYRDQVIGPIVAAIQGAKSAAGLKRPMSAALVKRMDTAPMADALGTAMTQASLIGTVAATPAEPAARE